MKKLSFAAVFAALSTLPAHAVSDEEAFAFYKANRGSHCEPTGLLSERDTLEGLLEGDQESSEKPTRYTISYQLYGQAKTISLWQFSCYAAAYNFGSAFVIEQEEGVLEILQLAMPAFSSKIFEKDGASLSKYKHTGFISTHVVSNGGFVSSDNTIVHFHKLRGIGDQYEIASWKFLEGQFVLTNYELEPNGQELPTEYQPKTDENGDPQPLIKMHFGKDYVPEKNND